MPYEITREPWGFRLMFRGFIRKDEATRWVSDAEVQLSRVAEPFAVVVDMRGCMPFPADAQAVLRKGQEAFRAAGMTRSAVVVDNAVTALQLARTATLSGIASHERYIPADRLGWEDRAMGWALDGMEPDR